MVRALPGRARIKVTADTPSQEVKLTPSFQDGIADRASVDVGDCSTSGLQRTENALPPSYTFRFKFLTIPQFGLMHKSEDTAVVDINC